MDINIPGLSSDTVFRNLSYEDLYQHEIDNGECQPTASGANTVDTSPFTGRSPRDKFIVEQAGLTDDIWWGGSKSKDFTRQLGYSQAKSFGATK